MSALTPDIFAAIALIFGGCCTNMLSLELLVNDARSSGQLILFAQFIFQTLVSLPYVLQSSFPPTLKERKVPLTRWLVMVVLYYANLWLNALALACNVSMPLHIIFRSGGLLGALIVGKLFGGKQYSTQQVVAVVTVTLGIVLATLSDAASQTRGQGEYNAWWIVGIGSLVACVFVASFLGLFQEVTYTVYGKQWKEAMFYLHALSLPIVLMGYEDLLKQVELFNASPPVSLMDALPLETNVFLLPLIPFWKLISTAQIPVLWIYLVGNVLSQYVCISGVMRLTTLSTSLTINLVLSLRKLVSLVLSVWWFGNRLTYVGMAGCVLVGVGTMLYVNHSSKPTVTTVRKEQ
jgi:UDP-xylose/UDP-N-acetylglucosamine transporter B4